MKLYGYWRSSASWRARIGLHLKGLPFEYVPVNLLTGAHKSPAHLERNPAGQVPVLELDDGRMLTQSLAILRWLDTVQPSPPLFPQDPWAGAQALALAEIVNAGTQPLQNLSVLAAVTEIGGDRAAWGKRFISAGLHTLQTAAAATAGDFLVGDQLSVADICLIPQLYNARRFDCDLDALPLLTAIEARCSALPAFERAHPSVQADATP